MGRPPLDDNTLTERHRIMLKLKEKIYPFTTTTREIRDAWGLHSLTPVVRTLRCLAADGRVMVRETGKTHKYYAV